MQIGYGQTQKIEVRYDNSASPGQDCALHPLIHTLLEFNLAQDVVKKKAESVTPLESFTQ